MEIPKDVANVLISKTINVENTCQFKPEFIRTVSHNMTSMDYSQAGDTMHAIINAHEYNLDIFSFILLYKLGYIAGQQTERARRRKASSIKGISI
jgi:hypothetical protein